MYKPIEIQGGYEVMDIEKTIRNYTKIYRRALTWAKIADIDGEIAAYEKRLKA